MPPEAEPSPQSLEQTDRLLHDLKVAGERFPDDGHGLRRRLGAALDEAFARGYAAAHAETVARLTKELADRLRTPGG